MAEKIAVLLQSIFFLTVTGAAGGVLTAAQENPPSSLAPAPASAEKDQPDEEIVATVHRLVNEFRQKRDLGPLTLDPIISAAAREHSADMARHGDRISHRGFERRLQDIRKKLPYRAAAENIAAIDGYNNPARVAVEGWGKSPEHRNNMLGDFSLTGIGIAQGEDGRYFFTQIFIEPQKK